MPAAEWQYQTLPAQRTFHSDLQTRFKGYSGPIGSGKSYALVDEALFLSRMNPGLLGLVGAPTYRMLQDSTQRTFFEVLHNEGIEYTFNKQRNHLKFSATGSDLSNHGDSRTLKRGQPCFMRSRSAARSRSASSRYWNPMTKSSA